MNNNRFKLFLENFLFYGGLSMLMKGLPFITLPLITRLLPNTEAYGIVDMFNLINSFGMALVVMGMYDAIFREFFEDKNNIEYQKKVTSTGLIIVLFSAILIVILVLLLHKEIALLLFKDKKYCNLVILSAFSIGTGGISTIISSPTRMRNKRKVFLYTGVSFPVIGFIITYILIKIGYTYKAIVYSNLTISIISLFVFYILNKKDFRFKLFEKKIAKELLKIGLPLLPIFVIYWIYNSMDRIMINRMLGPEELGIYSIGSKVASVSQLIYTAFAGGWQYFAFSTMKDEDQVELNSRIFEYLGVVSFSLFIISQPFIKPVFNLFFLDEYRRGSEVFSYLFLSPLILMLFQIISNQLIVLKKSYLITTSLLSGAAINIMLNYFLIKGYGIKGAALSTLLSYILSVIIMSLICLKYKVLRMSKRFIIVSIIIITLILIKFFMKNSLNLILFIFLMAIFGGYFNDLKNLFGGKNVKTFKK